MRHRRTECPKCKATDIPVYELSVPNADADRSMGAVHLAAHGCPNGGDHMQLQGPVSLRVRRFATMEGQP